MSYKIKYPNRGKVPKCLRDSIYSDEFKISLMKYELVL
ncbi:hypothetical protein PAMA111031_10920 [Paraphotobacterium marinum]